MLTSRMTNEENRNTLLNAIARESNADLSNIEDRNACRATLVTFLVEQDVPIEKAFNFVWGVGSYAALVSQVYNDLKETA